MHILVVTQYFWPEQFRINDLVTELVKQGQQVTVLTGMPNYPQGKWFNGYGWFKPTEENYNGVTIKRVPLWPRGKGRSYELILNYFSFMLSAMLLGIFRCRDQYDVIFVFQTSPITVAYPAILLKKLHKIPLIMWVQDLWPESLSAVGAIKSKRILNWVERWVRGIYRQCDLILAQSKAFIPKIRKQAVPQEKLLYFPNWAEANYVPRQLNEIAAEIKSKLPTGFIIVFAGNLGAAQSLPTLIAAAKHVRAFPDIHWVVLGDGRKRADFLQEISAQQLTNIHWLGQKPMEEMSDYYGLADVLLVTLRRDPIFELTIPSKVQSYLACAKPIVAALDGEGCRVIKEAQAGLVVPTEDGQALGEAVLQLYRMTPKQRETLGQQGYGYFQQHFNRDKLIAEFIDFCRAYSTRISYD